MGIFQSKPIIDQPPCFDEGVAFRKGLPNKKEVDISGRPVHSYNTKDLKAEWNPNLTQEDGSITFCCYSCGKSFDSMELLTIHLLEGRGLDAAQMEACKKLHADILGVMLLVIDMPKMKSFVSINKEGEKTSVAYPNHYEALSHYLPHTIVNITQQTLDIIEKQTTPGCAFSTQHTLVKERESVRSMLGESTCPHCKIEFETPEELAFHLIEQYVSRSEAVKNLPNAMESIDTFITACLETVEKTIVEHITAMKFYIVDLPPFSTKQDEILTSAMREELHQDNKAFLLVSTKDQYLEDYVMQGGSTRQVKPPHHHNQPQESQDAMIAHYMKCMSPHGSVNVSKVDMMDLVRQSEQPIMLPFPDGFSYPTILLAPKPNSSSTFVPRSGSLNEISVDCLTPSNPSSDVCLAQASRNQA